MSDWIESFEKFLVNDLENIIAENMLIANPKPRVILLQRPGQCDRDSEIAHAGGIIDIAGKQYTIKVTADHKLDMIFIKAEPFEITIAFNFYRGSIEEVDTGIPESYVRDPHILAVPK